MEFSLITLVFNRETHLKNMLKAVQNNSLKPSEIIIINMGDMPELSSYDDLPLIVVDFQKYVDGPLPLAAARNAGAKNAKYELLFFLDVDCVPSFTYFEDLLEHHEQCQGLIMATPRYLTSALPQNFDEKDLIAFSVSHPHRPNVKPYEHFVDGGMFWSLCFTTKRSTFFELGGFDEQFVGYGGEDTDFGFSLCKERDGFFISSAQVYHQQHPVYNPPLHKMNEIVRNSQLFYNKWGIWPMGAWLQEFVNHDLISWHPEATKITIKSYPNKRLLNACYKEDAAFM